MNQEKTSMNFLIPVDFSDASASMLRFAFSLNRHFFARMEVLHLFDIPITVGDDSEVYLKNYEAYRKSYADELWDFVRRNKGEYKYETEVFATAGGHYQGIVDFANKHHPDLLIVGHRGVGAMRRWFFGSVSRFLLTHPPVPVLSVPEDYAPAGESPVTRILVATDLVAAIPEKSVVFLRRFAGKLKAGIDLVHVKVKDELKLPDEGDVIRSLETSLEAPLEFLETRPGEQVSDAIDKKVKEGGYDLLVTVPHAHTWLDRLMIGSETRDLATLMEIPVMSLPGQ
jgi:nucleotide-binding universal stress UspA family protein